LKNQLGITFFDSFFDPFRAQIGAEKGVSSMPIMSYTKLNSRKVREYYTDLYSTVGQCTDGVWARTQRTQRT
jgi:hypothetical protein